MTKVDIAAESGRYDIRIEGHAGYHPGMDIVCSAVSVLAYTLMQALKEEDERGNMEQYDCRCESGNVHISAAPAETCRKKIDVIVNTVSIGFMLLADQYPENVELNI